jgi:hypothetical protein
MESKQANKESNNVSVQRRLSLVHHPIAFVARLPSQPLDQGGLGIHGLGVKNMILLSKWLFKLLTKDGTWQTILKRKYVGSKALSHVL